MNVGKSRLLWKHQRLILVAVIAAVALMIFLLIFLLLFQSPNECKSSTCEKVSLELLEHYIDKEVDPCDNFYRFSCGNFLKNAELDHRGIRSTKSVLYEDIQSQIKNLLLEPEQSTNRPVFNLAKKFYRACMNESAIQADGLKSLKQIFQQIGGWPTLLGNNWRENAFDWKDALRKLRRIGINVDFFLIHSIQKDKVNPGRYILNLEDPSYGPSAISDDIKKFHLQYMVDVATLMGASKFRAKVEQNECIDFMIKLAKILEDAAVTTNGTHPYNPFTLSEMDYAFPEVSWQEYLNGILSPVTEITYDDVILVSNTLYLKKLVKLLENTNKRIVANFMVWQVIQQTYQFLPAEIYNRSLELIQLINKHEAVEPRWKMCAEETQKRFGFVISLTYIEKHLDQEARFNILSMIRNIKYQFRENLYKLDWLDEATKNIVVEMLVTSVENIASSDNFIEKNNIYNQVEIREDKLLISALNFDYMAANIRFRRLRHPEAEESMCASTVYGLNIFYSAKENCLSIPVGLFQGVFYMKDRPEYMNYGALGSVIAHEIYHVITEAETGLHGDSRSRWSSHSLLNYDGKLRCLANQYNKFVVTLIEQHLNTSNTRNEDMADLAGVKIAYDTYSNWVNVNGIEEKLLGLNYSYKQLFWIASAIHRCTKYSEQVLHRYIAYYRKSPAEFRVNGPLQNLDEFALDWGCPRGTNMNPDNKCRIW